MTGTEILTKANAIITGHRTEDYGQAEDSFSVIAGYWSTYLGREVSRLDVATMMLLMKAARITTAQGEPTLDCFIDICGYAALGGQMVSDKDNGK